MSQATIIKQVEKVMANPLLHSQAVQGANSGAERLRSANQWLGRNPR